MKPTDFEPITQADRRRCVDVTTATALLFAETSRLSNRALAAMLGSSEYGVRKVRKLMSAQGTLGIVPGSAPSLPRISETTRGRLGTVLADTEELPNLAEIDGVGGPALRRLKLLRQYAMAVYKDGQQPLQLMAAVAQELSESADDAQDEYDLLTSLRSDPDAFLPPARSGLSRIAALAA